MQTKDQATDDPFRGGEEIGTTGSKTAVQGILRKAPVATIVQSQSPNPIRRHHIKVSPLASSPSNSQLNKTTWQEQMDHLLSANIAAGAANDKSGETISDEHEVVVDKDFFSKWTLRYRAGVNSRNNTICILSGLILNSIFGIIEYLLSPHHLFTSQLAIIRFGVVIPIFLVAFMISRIGHTKLGRGIHVMACVLVASSGIAVLLCHYFSRYDIPHSVFTAQYALVIIYFVILYTGLLVSYIILAAVVGNEMKEMLKWSIMPFVVLGSIAIVSSYKTEQLIRSEWILITMGERSKRKREKQKATVEDLLTNILPKKVVHRLKEGYVGTFAEDFNNCTIMFADVCDFGGLLSTLSPCELVETLDTIFSGFDTIMEQYPMLEKVKTIGDCYMVAGNALEKSTDHAQQMVNCALDMLGMIQGMSIKQGGNVKPLAIRIGIHSGLVHAGLIGWTKMIYDMWGETVDIAKMCEAQGMPNVIQITHTTFNQLRAFDFRYEPSQPIVVRQDRKIDTMSISGRNFRKDMERYVGSDEL